MLRRLFTLLSAASLVLFSATCAMWWRSYRGGDKATWGSPEPAYAAWSIDGRIEVDDMPGVERRYWLWNRRFNEIVSSRAIGKGGVRRIRSEDEEREWERERAARDRAMQAQVDAELARLGPRPPVTASFQHVIPYKRPAAATAALPAAWIATAVWRAVRRRVVAGRRRAGRCAACGYDLRASPGRCPECGAVATGDAPGSDDADRQVARSTA